MTKTWIMRNTGSVPWTPTTTKVDFYNVFTASYVYVIGSKNSAVAVF